jgi:hypothetical protein
VERRDYIERQIQQIGEFIARILGLSAQNPAEAARVADEALARITGFPLGMLLRLGASGLLRTLGPERAIAAIPLLKASAAAFQASGRGSEEAALLTLTKDLERAARERGLAIPD